MNPISWRTQRWFIAAGYAAVFVIATGLVLARYLLYITHPADVAAAGGMYAAGDIFLAIFIAGLFMVPTAFLVWAVAKFETFYTRYSQVLLGLSLSAPVCLSVFHFGGNHVPQSLSLLCLCRLLLSPFILVEIGVSRLVARLNRAKKLISYALLIEGLTLGTAVALLIRG